MKYFSGTGTYVKTIEAPADWFSKDRRLWIDLGDVKNLAEVEVNGESLGIVWHAPYRVDATRELRPGANTVSIKVTNAWVNRLIGDEQPDAKVKYTFADVRALQGEFAADAVRTDRSGEDCFRRAALGFPRRPRRQGRAPRCPADQAGAGRRGWPG